MLVEKLALALAVAAMQRYGAAPQIILAHAVLFVALLLQWHFCPYACLMLDTLQRVSLYALLATCYVLTVPALDSILQRGALPHPSLLYSALAVAGLINISLVALFVYAMVIEGRRTALTVLDKDGKGHVTWCDVKAFAVGLAPGCLPVQCIGRGGRGAKRPGVAQA